MSKDPPNTKAKWKALHRVLTWGAASTDGMHDLVRAVTDSGNAVMFSRTIDGSALVLSVYSGNEKSKEYVTDPGDIVPLFEWVMETYS